MNRHYSINYIENANKDQNYKEYEGRDEADTITIILHPMSGMRLCINLIQPLITSTSPVVCALHQGYLPTGVCASVQELISLLAYQHVEGLQWLGFILSGLNVSGVSGFVCLFPNIVGHSFPFLIPT